VLLLIDGLPQDFDGNTEAYKLFGSYQQLKKEFDCAFKSKYSLQIIVAP
jgi:hypothetical protein